MFDLLADSLRSAPGLVEQPGIERDDDNSKHDEPDVLCSSDEVDLLV
jgi:hypothetical protein